MFLWQKLVQEFNTREKLMLQEVIYIEIWKQVDNAQQVNKLK
jgi:hypothetical protein